MSNALSKILIFAAGALTGSIVTWKVFKARYEIISDSEEAEETPSDENEARDRSYELIDEFREKKKQRQEDRAEVKNICKGQGYGQYDDMKGDDEDMDRPYVIPPEEVGEDYDVVSLNYYTDGVLADDKGNVIRKENYNEFVGADFADHFGEYEDDSVFVRNNVLQKDYEILMEYRAYSDVYKG